MGKVVKVLAVVAGIALAIPTGGTSLLATTLGVSSLAATAIVAGLTVGASLLAKRPKVPRSSPESIERLNASIDPRTPRKGVFGSTAMNTDIRDQEYTDTQTYLHRFIVVAAHKVQGIREIWFDDKRAWTLAGGVQGEFAGYLTVTPILEGNAGNAINISARMGSTRRYTGCAYVYVRYKLTGNSKKTESPFAQSIPTRITIVGDGALVYDPRLDSTLTGGSGSHRADDQSTWEWDADAARNPALLLLWYLLGWRINGIVSIGCGIPPERIDLESFITAANLCDEPVSLAAGGTEPRYRADGVFSDGEDPTNVIDNLKAAMNADLDDVGGKFRLTVFHNDLADPGPEFTDDDMVEGFRWIQTPALSDSFNIVRGSYTDPRDASLYQLVNAPPVEIASRDGIDRYDTFDLAFVQSPSQWQRLAKQRLQRQQYGGEFTTTFNVRGWLMRKNMVIPLSFTRLGWTSKLFRVAEMEHRVDGTCPVVLREENEDIYAWDEDEAPEVQTADPTVYDFDLDPVYQGIDDAGAIAGVPAGISEIIINADYTGAITTFLPKTQPYTLLRNGVDVTADASWAVTVLTGTIAASFSAPGMLELDLSGGILTSATLRIEATYNGLVRPLDVKVTKQNAQAPTGGGSGSGSVSKPISGALLTTTPTAITPDLELTVGASGTVDLSATYTFSTDAVSGGQSMSTQWYEWNGSAYVAISGSAVDASTAYSPATGVEGEGGNSYQHTGQTPAAVKKYRLYGWNTGGGTTTWTRYVGGTANAVST